MGYDVAECPCCYKPAYLSRRIKYKEGRKKAQNVDLYECSICHKLITIYNETLKTINVKSIVGEDVITTNREIEIVASIPEEYKIKYQVEDDKRDNRESTNKEYYIQFDGQKYCNNAKCKNYGELEEFNSGYIWKNKEKCYLKGLRCSRCGRVYYSFHEHRKCREAYKEDRIHKLSVPNLWAYCRSEAVDAFSELLLPERGVFAACYFDIRECELLFVIYCKSGKLNKSYILGKGYKVYYDIAKRWSLVEARNEKYACYINGRDMNEAKLVFPIAHRIIDEKLALEYDDRKILRVFISDQDRCEMDGEYLIETKEMCKCLSGENREIVFHKCCKCNRKYLSANEVTEYSVGKTGQIIAEFIESKEANFRNKYSKLYLYGYNVSSKSEFQRRKVLEEIIKNSIMTKGQVISFLQYLVNFNGAKKENEEARGKWLSDIDYMNDKYKDMIDLAYYFK